MGTLINNRFLIRMFSRLHRVLYQVSGGRIGGNAGGPALLLTTTGRKSGRSRTTPLLYLEEGPAWAVVASNAGDERHPAWWINLRDHPVATIQVGPARKRVHAREASQHEKRRLWPRFVRIHRGYEDYRRRTSREIPVVILEPQPDDGTDGSVS